MDGKLSAFEYSERLQKARAWAERMIRFPFVRKVSLTGSMATAQATKQSDIDFFIQVEEGNLWWVRLAITMWVHIAGQRRTGMSVANKLCLNWFATFDGPLSQRRPHIVLAERSSPDIFPNRSKLQFLNPNIQTISKSQYPNSKNIEVWNFEKTLRPLSPLLEFLACNLQYHRFTHDPRTHLKNSQVRFSNTELGFHPPKHF